MNLQGFLSNYKAAVNQLLDSYHSLTKLKMEYDALDLGNVLTDEDCSPYGFTKAELMQAVYTYTELVTLMNSGHKTNLFKVK